MTEDRHFLFRHLFGSEVPKGVIGPHIGQITDHDLSRLIYIWYLSFLDYVECKIYSVVQIQIRPTGNRRWIIQIVPRALTRQQAL